MIFIRFSFDTEALVPFLWKMMAEIEFFTQKPNTQKILLNKSNSEEHMPSLILSRAKYVTFSF